MNLALAQDATGQAEECHHPEIELGPGSIITNIGGSPDKRRGGTDRCITNPGNTLDK